MSRVTAALTLLACVGVASASATNTNYVVERSLDDGESWTSRGTVLVTGATVNAAKARFSPSALAAEASTNGVTVEERKAILGAERILYRVREQATAEGAIVVPEEVARIVTTPCSLVRGFNLKTTKEAELVESLNVVITKDADNNNKVTGLQFVPRTNLHHSSNTKYSNHGDSCDKEVLDLFPTLTVSTTVGVARPTVPKRLPKYEESLYHGGADQQQQNQQQQQQQNPNQKLNEEGKPVDAEGKVIPEPDNRSFFEKYWHYILMFVAWNFVQQWINPKKDGAAAAAGAAPAAAAKK